MNIHDCIYFHGTCIRYVLCFVACYTLNAEIFKVFVREYYNIDNLSIHTLINTTFCPRTKYNCVHQFFIF